MVLWRIFNCEIKGLVNVQLIYVCFLMSLHLWLDVSKDVLAYLKTEKKWKCVIFKCYSSEKLITLNILHEVVPTWYSLYSWVDWSNADKVSCSRKQHTAAVVRTVYLCIQNRHSSQPTNMLAVTERAVVRWMMFKVIEELLCGRGFTLKMKVTVFRIYTLA